MTKLKLHADLSYCKIDGRLIFLDIQNDRYFRLTGHLASALLTYLDDGNAPASSIRTLIERKILVDEPDDSECPHHSLTKAPTRSALEEVAHSRRASVGDLLDTFAIVYSIQHQLKTRSLKNALRNLVNLREKHTSQASMFLPSEVHVMEAAAAFRSARLYVPIDMSCLLDSIAMIKFLTKRGMHADLVFGVTGEPFSAHCWAQYNTTVLNDALGNTSALTPIKVI